jgi:hypothetical protein
MPTRLVCKFVVTQLSNYQCWQTKGTVSSKVGPLSLIKLIIYNMNSLAKVNVSAKYEACPVSKIP